MARIPYLTDAELTPDQRAVIQGRVEVFGRSSAFQRIVTRTPKVARWFLPFVYSLQRGDTGGLLDGRTKELAVLKTSSLNACSFCMAHNVSLGGAVGLSEEQIAAVTGADYESSASLTDRDKAVVRWAESVTLNRARRDMDGFARLKEHFTDDEIVELTWVAALFNMINRITDSLWLDVEEEDVVGMRVPITEERIVEFARRMVAHADATSRSGASEAGVAAAARAQASRSGNQKPFAGGS